METDSADHNEVSYEMRLCRSNARLRRENQVMRKRVGRLEILLSDVPDFVGEKKAMLEALGQCCEREQEARERLRGEELETRCLEDALSDIRYIKGAQRKRRIKLRLAKRDVFRAECDLVDAQHTLAKRDEVLGRRDAEIAELVTLHENCAAHVDVTAARLEDATQALNDSSCAGTTPRHPDTGRVTKKESRKKRTPPVRPLKTKERRYRVQDILVTAFSFIATLLIFLLIIMSFTPDCSGVWEFLLGDMTERLLPLMSVHHIGPLDF